MFVGQLPASESPLCVNYLILMHLLCLFVSVCFTGIYLKASFKESFCKDSRQNLMENFTAELGVFCKDKGLYFC